MKKSREQVFCEALTPSMRNDLRIILMNEPRAVCHAFQHALRPVTMKPPATKLGTALTRFLRRA